MKKLKNVPEHVMDAPIFQDLRRENLYVVLNSLDFYKYGKGEFVFQPGDSVDWMFIICRGKMKVTSLTSDGREQVLYLFTPGDFVGGHNILGDKNYQYSGRILEETIIAKLSASVFRKYIMDNVCILRRILQQSFERIRRAEELIARLSGNHALDKVIDLLLWLNDSIGTDTKNGRRLDLNMNREELGSFSGMTRETITRKLSELREAKLIEFDGTRTIILKDVEKLQEVREEIFAQD